MNSESHRSAVRAAAERAQRVDRAALLRLGSALPGAFDAESRRIGGLVVAGVAAGVLAERRGVLLDLEQIVADLEHEPDVAREHVEVARAHARIDPRARSAS